MKLLFLNLYSGNIERGAESFTHQLIDQLRQYHSLKLIKGNSSTHPTSTFSKNILSMLQKRLFLDLPARQVFFFTLQHLPHILKSNYQVILPLNGFWQLLLLKLIQPFKGFKIIVTGHSGPGWDERWNLYLHPNYFVATTKPTLHWAQKTCPWTKSVLIPYAIDPAQFLVKPAKLKLKKPLILCPSALVPYKRLDLVIKAVAQLSDASLLILGTGPLEKKLKSLGHRQLKGRFLLGSVSHAQMPAYYQAATVVTLPSDPQENSPMVFLEALSANKSIVATDSPRNRWMLGDSALYTDPQDTISYANQLKLAIDQIPNNHALQKFLWPNVLAKYLQLLINQATSD